MCQQRSPKSDLGHNEMFQVTSIASHLLGRIFLHAANWDKVVGRDAKA